MIAVMTSAFVFLFTLVVLMFACGVLMIIVVGNFDRRSPLKNMMMLFLFAMSVAASLSIVIGLLHHIKNGF